MLACLAGKMIRWIESGGSKNLLSTICLLDLMLMKIKLGNGSLSSLCLQNEL